MANLKQRLRRKNSSGSYDIIYLQSDLSNVTGTLQIANGGTGATSASSALTNLGAAASSHNHTATAITYGSSNVSAEIDSLKSSVSNGKTLIAAAVTDKGVPTAATETFANIAYNISLIETKKKPPLPEFSATCGWRWINYKTNEYTTIEDPDAVLGIISSGSITFHETVDCEVFCVGGGGGGTLKYADTAATDGISTSINNIIAAGGYCGTGDTGGNGGSGGGCGTNSWNTSISSGIVAGNGGSDGSNGTAGSTRSTPGIGQGTTTRAFLEPDGFIYSGGGGGGAYGNTKETGTPGDGGINGGGRGSSTKSGITTNINGIANTGGGGGGGSGYYKSGSGGTDAGPGGGGGYTTRDWCIFTANSTYSAVIGAGGSGGKSTSSSSTTYTNGGNGGSGIILIRRH